MTVPKEAPEFVVNVMKAVIEPLRIEPLTGVLSGPMSDPMVKSTHGKSDSYVFSQEEETIFGRCECQYVIAKLPRELEVVEKEELSKRIKEDEQKSGRQRSGRGSVPEIEEHLWRVIKAVDFEKCHDRVILQVSNHLRSNFELYEQ